MLKSALLYLLSYDTTMRAASFATYCIFLAFNHNSLAQHMNSPEAPCRTRATTVDMTNCFSHALHDANRDLQQTYSAIRTKLAADEFAQLLSAERLWLQYREANCNAERDLYSGGTAAPVAYLACMEEDTRLRAKELKTMYGWRLEK